MKKPLKITIICIISAIFLLGGTLTAVFFFTPNGDSPADITVKSDGNFYIENNTKNIADCSPTETLFTVAFKIKNLNSYYATITGKVDAGITTQQITGEKYKSGGAALYSSRSQSALKSTADRIFIENNAVIYRKGNPSTGVYDGTAVKYTLNGYLAEYGTDFRELSNYMLNEKTVINGELLAAADGKYTYRYEIDVKTGVDAYRVNMAKTGNLGGLPTFKKSTLEITVKEDFTPVSVKHTDEYSVKMLFTVPCVSTLTEIFTKINEEVVIPEYDFFAAQSGL